MERRYRCRVCDEGHAAFVEAMLLHGHSCACVAWHLRRLWCFVAPEMLSHHVELHASFSLHSDEGIRLPLEWKYTPPAAPMVSECFRPELVLIRGIPYSGKSRFAATFGATHVHVEADQYYLEKSGHFAWKRPAQEQAHDWARGWTREALRLGHNVVVANTFLRNVELETYYQIAEDIGANVVVYEMPRLARPPGRLKIAASRLTRMQNLWEPLACHADAWGTTITVCQVPADALTQPLPPALSYFCQPELCRHTDGYRWATFVAAAVRVCEDTQQRSFMRHGRAAVAVREGVIQDSARAPLDHAMREIMFALPSALQTGLEDLRVAFRDAELSRWSETGRLEALLVKIDLLEQRAHEHGASQLFEVVEDVRVSVEKRHAEIWDEGSREMP